MRFIFRFVAVAFLFLSVSAHAGYRHGTAPLVAPPQAAAAGFHTNLFTTNFNDTSTVDLANSGAATFQWFIRFAWSHACDAAAGGTGDANCDSWVNFPPQSGSNFSSVGGNLHSLFGAGGSPASNINVISAIQNGASFTGKTFGGGFYIEGRSNWQYTPTGPPGTALFLFPVEFLEGTAAKFVELDIMETFSSTQTRQVQIVWDFTANPGTFTPNGVVNSGTINVGDFHTWGVLWQTIAQHGGGTGLISFYMDNVLQKSTTYIITDPLAVMESHHYILIWSADNTNPSPTNLAFYRVWGMPYLLNRDLHHDNDNMPAFLNAAA